MQVIALYGLSCHDAIVLQAVQPKHRLDVGVRLMPHKDGEVCHEVLKCLIHAELCGYKIIFVNKGKPQAIIVVFTL